MLYSSSPFRLACHRQRLARYFPGSILLRVPHSQKSIAFRQASVACQIQSNHAEAEKTESLSPISVYPPSKRAVKRSTESPAVELIEVLRQHAHENTIPYTPYNRLRQGPSKRRLERKSPRQSLQAICARFIASGASRSSSDDRRSEGLTTSLLGLDHDEASYPDVPLEDFQLLKRYHLTMSDVELWTWIITEADTYRACHRLWSACTKSLTPNKIPTWILLFLLRRRYIPPDGLMLLFAVARHMLNGQEDHFSPSSSEQKKQGQNNPFRFGNEGKVILFIRLIRQAHHVYPDAMTDISNMIILHLSPHLWTKSDDPNRYGQTVSRITTLYNVFLRLLGNPSHSHPYKYSKSQERAQFVLLRKMGEMDPPLAITEDGYTALVGVQLRRSKTRQERDWADLKSTLWPPFKVSHTAADEAKDRQYGTSRAGHIINRMQEAGYHGGSWSEVAQVLAGWDTDDSPTIQTRKFLPLHKLSKLDSSSHRYLSWLWRSRIQATRTVNEAWACFLAFEEAGWPSTEPRPSAPYIALLEKIHFHEKQSAQAQKTGSMRELPKAWGGEGKEVSIADLPPNASVYLPRDVPSIDEVIDMMVQKNVHLFSTQLITLALIVPHLEAFTKCLSLSPGALDDFHALVDHEKAQLKPIVRRIHPKVFNATCTFLLDKRHTSRVHQLTSRLVSLPANLPDDFLPIFHVWTLLRFQPHNLGLWEALFRATISSHGKIYRVVHPAQTTDSFAASYFLIRRMLADRSDVDTHIDPHLLVPAFTSLDMALRNILSSQVDRTEGSDEQVSDNNFRPDPQPNVGQFNHFMDDAGTYICRQFYGSMHNRWEWKTRVWLRNQGGVHLGLLSGDLPIEDLPPLLKAPPIALLHGYVRCLGLLGDWRSLEKFAYWIAAYWDSIEDTIKESKGGRKLFRRTIVAMRVLFQGAHVREVDGFDEWKQRHGRDLRRIVARKRIRRLMAKWKNEWGGWPNDDEVRAYARTRDSTPITSLEEEYEEDSSVTAEEEAQMADEEDEGDNDDPVEEEQDDEDHEGFDTTQDIWEEDLDEDYHRSK